MAALLEPRHRSRGVLSVRPHRGHLCDRSLAAQMCASASVGGAGRAVVASAVHASPRAARRSKCPDSARDGIRLVLPSGGTPSERGAQTLVIAALTSGT